MLSRVLVGLNIMMRSVLLFTRPPIPFSALHESDSILGLAWDHILCAR
jgi:hypothetical protein